MAPSTPQPVPVERSHEVLVGFVFEPALPAPSRFVVVHESGLLRECGAGRTGCEVRLPPGPATLGFEIDGQPSEFVFVVRQAEEFVIRRSDHAMGLGRHREARR